MTAPFRNAPRLDFTQADVRRKSAEALARVRGQLGKMYTLFIDGKEVMTERVDDSVNPSNPKEIIGRNCAASPEHVEQAVAAAVRARETWGRTSPEERAALLDRLADHMQERRFEWNAWLALEIGKTCLQADGEVVEGIDFCRYYAAQMRALGRPHRTQQVPGEDNDLVWIPRGVAAVIAPWNFPMAILCGMTVAAIVAGNPVLVKPSKQSSVIAAKLFEALREVGCPPGVANLLTGPGSKIGPQLSSHPKIDIVAFTGSREVGLEIWENAGRTQPRQANLKKVICEMGGKNACIIDADADLDEALVACLESAFGYQGQKCSALSRLILLDEIHDRFVARLAEATAAIKVGPAEDPATFLAAVIDADAQKRILQTIEAGKREAKLFFQGQVPQDGGYYVPATIFTDVAPTADLAQHEIFGPVLSVLRARDFDHALELANDSDYALTGGCFSRSPKHLARARAELQAGNLYLNRGTTGAVVERQPFGGYKMSGGGTKAGGADYVREFLFPRTISENTMRRGFSPQAQQKTAVAVSV